MTHTLSDQDRQTVRAILVQQLGITEDQVTPDAAIQEDLGADSLDVFEIIMLLEERFDLSITDEETDGIRTVSDLEEALAACLAAVDSARR